MTSNPSPDARPDRVGLRRHPSISILAAILLMCAPQWNEGAETAPPAPREAVPVGTHDGPADAGPTPRGQAEAPSAPAAPVLLTLAQAEALLLERNSVIAAARSGVDSAKASQLIARYRPNPSLTLSAEQFNTKHPFVHLTSSDPASQGYQHFYTVRIDQLLERGGKRDLRMLGARYQADAASAALQDAIRQQLFALHQAYIAAVLSRQDLDLARDELRITDQTMAIIRSKITIGAAPQADVLRLQVSRLQVQQAVLQAEAANSQALADLLNLFNCSLDHPGPLAAPAVVPAAASAAPGPMGETQEADHDLLALEPTLEIAPVPVPPDLANDIDARPDVIAARQTMAGAEVAVRQARALREEDLSLGLEYQRNGGDDTVGLALQIALPTFNDHRGDAAQAEAQYRQAQAQYRQVRNQALTDLDKAVTSVVATRAVLQLFSEETIGAAEESLHIAQETYRQGGSGLLELFDALHGYNATKSSFYQARFAYRQSLYQLELASGRALIPH
jgi:cobalt-zinc-cadmium efflux system outer membrane protein